MGRLSRENRYRILLAPLVLVLLVGLLCPPAQASSETVERKLHRLETLGLDIEDPTIIKAADGAHALQSVDVFPQGEHLKVVIQLSGLPSYNSSIFEGKRRLVLDLYNTINIAPSSQYTLGEGDPVKVVRNAQYSVDPSIVSRVVLELQDDVTPEITTDGNSLIITAPLAAVYSSGEPVVEVLEPVSTDAAIEDVLADLESETIEVAPMDAEAAGWRLGNLQAEAEAAEEIPEEIEEIAIVVEPVELETIEIAMAQTHEAQEQTLVIEVVEEAVEETTQAQPVAQVAEEVEIESAVQEQAEVIAEAIEEVEEFEEVAEEVVVEEVAMDAAPEIEPQVEIVEAIEEVVAEEVAIDAAPEIEPQVEIVEAIEEVVEEPTLEVAEAVDTQEVAEALNGMFAEMTVSEGVDASEVDSDEAAERLEEVLIEMKEAMRAEMVMVGTDPVESPAVEPAVKQEQDVVEASKQVDDEQNLITLVFRDAELSAVLDIISRKGNLNIVSGKDIKGSVTVRLMDVPLDVALNAILNINGYGYIKTDNILRILPISEIGGIVNLSTETYNLSYAKAEDAKTTLASFLTDNGNIEVDRRTNMLVVTDIPGNIERISKLVEKIDTRVQQVLIEVIILDSILLDDADLGVSWGLLNTQDRSLNTKAAQADDDFDAFHDQINVNLPSGADALNLVFGTLIGDVQLDMFIDAVVSDTDSRVLANPKILTLNNEMATIEIIQEFPYNDVTQTSSGGQLSNITFKEIGTKLEVKPQITHDDHVILWVAPEQNSIAGTTVIGVPIIDTRRAETTLILKNHQTIVMGGLRENRNVNTITKVPFFGDIPGLRYAFRSVQSDKQDTELLVFLTVHIVESPELLPSEQIKAEELANMPRHPNSTIELVRP